MKDKIVIGSTIRSRDGDVHHINSRRVAFLWKLNPDECYFLEDNTPHFEFQLRTLPQGLKTFYPSHDYNPHPTSEVK